jgi:hypothetical protein
MFAFCPFCEHLSEPAWGRRPILARATLQAPTVFASPSGASAGPVVCLPPVSSFTIKKHNEESSFWPREREPHKDASNIERGSWLPDELALHRERSEARARAVFDVCGQCARELRTDPGPRFQRKNQLGALPARWTVPTTHPGPLRRMVLAARVARGRRSELLLITLRRPPPMRRWILLRSILQLQLQLQLQQNLVRLNN